MILVEIQESSPQFQNFVAEEYNEGRKVNLDLLDEVREQAHVKAEALKMKVEQQQRSKHRPRQFQVADLVMRKTHPLSAGELVVSQMDRPIPRGEALGNGAYKLETLEGGPIPQTWNGVNLSFYFSLCKCHSCTIKGTLFFPHEGFLTRSPNGE